jgi:hypothetical protein
LEFLGGIDLFVNTSFLNLPLVASFFNPE